MRIRKRRRSPAPCDKTPHAYVESLRVEAARNRLETTDDTLDRIAGACGLGTVDTLVRAFRRRLDTTPTEYRRRFRTQPSTQSPQTASRVPAAR
ncbi:helix-turn-helix domain-containing protein [Flexivirga aerilata]|uniref:helix-turn-helix domain-containing protein n=1 Tax=Flexivirga aerilata TaxID=1656889 RepID=UPI0031B59CCF